MKNRSISQLIESGFSPQPTVLEVSHPFYRKITPENRQNQLLTETANSLPEILCITSYPPRECGIATYSQDLIKAMNNKFSNSFAIKVCALESASTYYNLYPKEVKYTLDTSRATGYKTLCQDINLDPDIKIVLIQHGNKSQGARQRALTNFKSGTTKVIVATDIAARGIDIANLELVINYDLPDVAETYVHRIGRTGRAGKHGTALTFCAPEERVMLKDIQKLTGKVLNTVATRA